MKGLRIFISCMAFVVCLSFTAPPDILTLTPEMTADLSRLALRCVHQEYPNKLDHVMNDKGEVRSPKRLHPSFYGCYDWHSAVHGHWMLVRLIKLFPELETAGEIRRALSESLSPENIREEVAYLKQPRRKSFERTYGWAWLLKLAEELHGWSDPGAQKWSKNLRPLAEAIVERYLDFLPKQTYPIRRGVHANTAFGLAFALDYARAVGDADLEGLIVERSNTYFSKDAACPAAWEPDGDDFFSPCLMEADLMRRVLPPKEFARWFRAFLPGIADRAPKSLWEPATVTDRSDPKIVHLDGLNLSRAWCMLGIASELDKVAPVRDILYNAALRHAEASLPHIVSGNYEGEHWLASFAVHLYNRQMISFKWGSDD